MAIEIGLAGVGNPVEIYENWFPNQIVSLYAYVVNKKYKEMYSQLPDKEQGKHPPVIISRVLTDEERTQYIKQQQRKVAKMIEGLGKKKTS